MAAGPLGRLALAVRARRGPVLAMAMVIGLVAAVIGLPPRVDTNAANLLPVDQPQAAALHALAKGEGATGAILLVFKGDEPEAMTATLRTLASELEALENVSWAMHGLDETWSLRIGLMQLDPAVTGDLASRLEMAVKLGPALNPMLAGRLLSVAPIAKQIGGSTSAQLLPDDGLGRIMVMPTQPSLDADFSVAVVRDVREVLAATDLEVAGVRHVHSGGPFVVVADGVSGVRSDLALTSGISVTLVLMVLIIGMRSVRAPLVIFPPIVLASVINLALLSVFVGSLNSFTSLGTAALVGLGMDFAVHLIGRYREERAGGADESAALACAWDRTGPPCITAALTSAAGFGALMWSDFGGVAQLGFSLSTGLLVSLVCMFVLLPALIPWLGEHDRPLLGALPAGPTAPTDVGRPTWARPAVAGALLLTVAAGAWGLSTLTFEYDFTTMGRDEGVFSEMDAATQARVRESYPPIVVRVPSVDHAKSEHRRLQGLIDAGELPHIRGIWSIERVLPMDREARVAALQRLRKLLDHPNLRYLPPPIVEQLRVLDGWTPGPADATELPAPLRSMLGDGHRLLLFPEGELHDMRQSAALIDELDAVVQGATSVQLLQGVTYRIILADAPWVSLLALWLVGVLTMRDLRRPTLIAAALFSLAAGMSWGLAAISALGIRMTLANVVGLPILLGIGIDVVIHLSHRLGDGESVPRALRTVGVAAMLSTVTTAASFFALTFAGTGSIRSLGQLVVVGLLVVTTVSTLALILAWTAARRS